VATAALCLNLGILVGFVQPAALRWPVTWLLGALLGGGAFGVGMVLAGGCVSRLLVRAASGNGKAGLALAALVAGAAVTMAWAPRPMPPPATTEDVVLSVGFVAAVLAILVGSSLRRPARMASGVEWPALVLGALVAAAAALTAPTGSAVPVNYVPAAHLTVDGNGETSGFLVALIAGTLLGAGIAARQAGRWRLEGFALDDDLVRHLAGGAVMGVGGTLVGGCTLGAGIGGTAMAAPAAWLGLAGMIAGAAWTVHVLASGGWQPAFRNLWSRP
jgi:uncharacterized membrane protein YedE/YeeE